MQIAPDNSDPFTESKMHRTGDAAPSTQIFSVLSNPSFLLYHSEVYLNVPGT